MRMRPLLLLPDTHPLGRLGRRVAVAAVVMAVVMAVVIEAATVLVLTFRLETTEPHAAHTLGMGPCPFFFERSAGPIFSRSFCETVVGFCF
jgi:hypothetical protein